MKVILSFIMNIPFEASYRHRFLLQNEDEIHNFISLGLGFVGKIS